MSDALRQSARNLGAVLAIGVGASCVLGAALALAPAESVPRWIAYKLYRPGAILVRGAFVGNTPPSPRHLANHRTIDRAQARVEGRDPDAVADDVPEKPFVSELVVLVVAGVALFAAGMLLEMAT